MKKLLLASVAYLALASGANAVVVNSTDIGAFGTTSIPGFTDDGAIAGLSAQLFLQFDGVSADGLTWNFDYGIVNTSGGNVTQARLSSWGLTTTPNITGSTSTGLYGFTVLNPSFPNVQGANVIEVCYTPNAGNCSGPGGLDIGGSALGEFTLTFSSVLTSISLDAAFARFQSLNITNPNTVGGSGVGISSDVQINPLAVPGPAVGALLPSALAGLGLLGFSWFRRRRLA